MIESSGQILTARAATDLAAVIEVNAEADGFHRTKSKGLMLADTFPEEDSRTKGTWAVISQTGNEAKFLGVVGDDTSPHANIKLDSGNPVLEWYQSHNFKQGDVMTVERNGIIPVIAEGAIKEGDLICLGDDGTFKKTTDIANAVGRSYENAQDGEVFRAFIKAL